MLKINMPDTEQTFNSSVTFIVYLISNYITQDPRSDLARVVKLSK